MCISYYIIEQIVNDNKKGCRKKVFDNFILVFEM